MQLDKTRIVIRERSHSELLDLSFHVLRAHAGPLLFLLALGTLPFIVINASLVGWMALTTTHSYGMQDTMETNIRYYWSMFALVFLQAPLATSLVTLYLGQAVFVERPQLRTVFEELRRLGPRQLWCQGVLRCALPVTLAMMALDRSDTQVNGGIEVGIVGIAFTLMAIVRSVRPYLSEIVLLERNPIFSRAKGAMTISRRARMLHERNGGDLFSHWLGTAIAAILLFYALYYFILFLQSIFTNDWQYDTKFMIHFGYPFSLWMIAGYVAVYRFLSYLNLRIHNEGWEVDLLLRAEATRLQEAPSIG